VTLKPGKKYWFTVVFEGDVTEPLKTDGYRPTLINGNTEIEVKGETRTEVRCEVQKYGKILRIER
jgi:hypothetical protein